MAQQAVAKQADLIIAAGGDGTVSAAASAVVNTEIPLAVIPRGTANAFVNGLGLPNTLEEACIAILQGATRTIGTVKCNDRLMLLLAGIGFEAETVQAANRDLKDKFGMLAYILAGLEQLQQPQNFEARLETEQQTITVPAIAVTVASIAPPTSILAQGSGELRPDDDLFDITILSPTSGLDALSSAVDLFTNGLVQSASDNDHIGYLRTNKVTITADPPQQIALDGEMIGTTPATFEMLPNSLTVVMDYNEFMAAQQKLVGLPGVDIVHKQDKHQDLVLNHFLPVNLLDVLNEQFLEVSQATVTLWHKVTTAIDHIGAALLESVSQTFYRILWGIDRLLEALLDSVGAVVNLRTEPPANNSAPIPTSPKRKPSALTQGIRIAHKTIGRIRVKVPRLSRHPAYCDQVHLQLHKLAAVQSVTINPVSASIVIYFDPKRPLSEMEQQVLTAVVQASSEIETVPPGLTIVEATGTDPKTSKDSSTPNPAHQVVKQASQQLKHLSHQAKHQVKHILERPIPLAADSVAGVAGAAAGFAIGEIVGGSIGAFFGPAGVVTGAEAGAWLGQIAGGQGSKQISQQLLNSEDSENTKGNP